VIDFFDTSALVKNYVRESGSQMVRAALRARRPAVARVTHAELASAFARLARDGVVDARAREALLDRIDEDFPTFEVIEWRAQVARGVRSLVSRHPLRALDAIQLASALALRVRPLRFWCADERLVLAAAAEGLRVVVPR
jgi:hypothetical protein